MEIISKIIDILGGLSLMVTLIGGYIGKLYFEKFKSKQVALNKQLQAKIDSTNNILKSKLENSIYVTRSHFDKEFLAYSDIWSAMFELKEDVLQFRPALDYINKDESEDERKLRRLNKFKGTFNTLVKYSEINKPFIPEEIYFEIREFRKACREESISYEHSEKKTEGLAYWKEAEENAGKILKRFENVCEKIRTRLHKLAVID